MNQCLWTNQLSAWFKSLGLFLFLNESVFLNKSVDLLIHWLILKIACFIPKWISVYEQINEVKNSLIVTYSVLKWISVYKQINEVKNSLIVTYSVPKWISVYEQINEVKNSLIVTYSVPKWISLWTN